MTKEQLIILQELEIVKAVLMSNSQQTLPADYIVNYIIEPLFDIVEDLDLENQMMKQPSYTNSSIN